MDNNRKRLKNGGRFLPPDLRPIKMASKPQLGEYIPERALEYDIQEGLPVDLQPRYIREYGRGGIRIPSGQGIDLSNEYLRYIADNTNIIASTLVLDRGLIGRNVTVTTTPTKIISAEFLRGYIIMNPSLVIGGSVAGTLVDAGLQTANGNSDPIGVANYRDLHLFLNVTAVSGASANMEIYSQALDPVSFGWADVQNIFSTITATGTYYANIGSLGLATDFRIRWVLTGTTPNFTFSVGFVLKEGLPGTGAGVGKTLYLGNSGVTTVAGFPLLEGQSRSFYLRENTELWAVADTDLELRIFEL